ncbi:hypothetical protein ACI68E_000641 [Malassezia pachydermatis]
MTPTRTPRTSLLRVLQDTQRENIPLPREEMPGASRFKTVEELWKVATARLEDLQYEKHALVNERESLKTEIQLGKQREYKLKAQVDKLETMIARYKERAVQFHKKDSERGAILRDKDTLEAQLQDARNDALNYAEKYTSLHDDYDHLQSRLMKRDDSIKASFQSMTRLMAEAGKSTKAEACKVDALQKHQRQLQNSLQEKDDQIISQQEVITMLSEQVSQLQLDRTSLMNELFDLQKMNSQFCSDSKEAEILDLDQELYHEQHELLQRDVAWAKDDASWFRSKWSISQTHIEWLESYLAHIQTVHANALRTWQKSKDQICAATETLQKQYKQSQAKVQMLEAEHSQWADAMQDMAWYQEAYEARTRQVSMLKELVQTHMDHNNSVQQAQEILANTSALLNTQALDTRIALLRQEEEKLQSRVNELSKRSETLAANLCQRDAELSLNDNITI